jgi:hypothetical protein
MKEKVTSADTSEDASEKLDKITLYLPQSLLDQIDILWFDLRRETPRKIKKSDVVRNLLERGIKSFKEEVDQGGKIR